ncbi:uncharacterized protein LOC123408240 [Hordeum vulgare subsp. vulgare]|uniref:uncharacterized protein LOC123408240 n=1 Tax=Hordeum vulgare subsp. vulgare TaxID=112509 RepID=UPI001D1A528B|nr:uncharacterized protein LOC123408240 [Hordeum vulgare subsp. vulgare]
MGIGKSGRVKDSDLGPDHVYILEKKNNPTELRLPASPSERAAPARAPVPEAPRRTAQQLPPPVAFRRRSLLRVPVAPFWIGSAEQGVRLASLLDRDPGQAPRPIPALTSRARPATASRIGRPSPQPACPPLCATGLSRPRQFLLAEAEWVLIDKMSALCAISTCLSQWNLFTRSPDALVVTNNLLGVFCIMVRGPKNAAVENNSHLLLQLSFQRRP